MSRLQLARPHLAERQRCYSWTAQPKPGHVSRATEYQMREQKCALHEIIYMCSVIRDGLWLGSVSFSFNWKWMWSTWLVSPVLLLCMSLLWPRWLLKQLMVTFNVANSSQSQCYEHKWFIKSCGLLRRGVLLLLELAFWFTVFAQQTIKPWNVPATTLATA